MENSDLTRTNYSTGGNFLLNTNVAAAPNNLNIYVGSPAMKTWMDSKRINTANQVVTNVGPRTGARPTPAAPKAPTPWQPHWVLPTTPVNWQSYKTQPTQPGDWRPYLNPPPAKPS